MYLFSQIFRTFCMVSCWFFLAAYKGDYSLLGHLLWLGHMKSQMKNYEFFNMPCFQTNKWKIKFTLSLPYTKYTLLVSLLLISLLVDHQIVRSLFLTIFSWLRLGNFSSASLQINGKGNLPWFYLTQSILTLVS